MGTFILRRALYMVPTLFGISVVAFIVITLPPGDFLSAMVAKMSELGEAADQATLEALRQRYGLDDPVHVQYFKWISSILTSWDFGFSFEHNRPVTELIGDRLPMTIALSIGTMFMTWIISFPIALYSAVKQYSFGDYFFTTIGFLGLATPNFLLALVFMYIGFKYFGQSVGGLYSPEYIDAPWSLAKFGDLLGHLWIPMLVIGTAGTAGLIRQLRANLLDELRKPYVVAARARGVPEWQMIFQYPLRIAFNPFISSIGWVLAGLVAGEAIIGLVLNLYTTGPLMINALLSQDMYLAGTVLLMTSTLIVIGTLVSDIALAWLDPRIRLRGYQ